MKQYLGTESIEVHGYTLNLVPFLSSILSGLGNCADILNFTVRLAYY